MVRRRKGCVSSKHTSIFKGIRALLFSTTFLQRPASRGKPSSLLSLALATGVALLVFARPRILPFKRGMSSILASLQSILFPSSSSSPTRISRQLYVGLGIGFALSLSSTSLALFFADRRRRKAGRKVPPRPVELRADDTVVGVIGLIGELSRSVRAL